jgi:hypothetical protein
VAFDATARVAGAGRAGVRRRDGVQGIDGDSASRRAPVRQDLSLQIGRRRTSAPVALLRRPGCNMASTRSLDVVRAAHPFGRVLVRRQSVDLSAQPDHHDRAVCLARRLAKLAGPQLRCAAAVDAWRGFALRADSRGPSGPDRNRARPPAGPGIPRRLGLHHAGAHLELRADCDRGRR